MYKYIIVFSKNGYVKYISHLDMQRLFSRAFRRCGLELQYSQGFNPHPKMSFAQPLSLGYSAKGEYIEFETKTAYSNDVLIGNLQETMPTGIQLIRCGIIPDEGKSLAASVEYADYTVNIPVAFYEKDYQKVIDDYLSQKQILTEKRQKKTKKMVETDIRPKIRAITAEQGRDDKLTLRMTLDCGSRSNVSPELVITSFMKFASFNCSRYEIEVSRDKLGLPVDYDIKWM